ncbi:acyltransferase family protein [Arthrobacter sp. B1805]|uniref:acyltransferase family protein n=1 Tax=Arthrobacter sp. B1805 TaxID=2058892 RepID=UPI0015E3AB0E|nr:acyltransferase family protein [Arthrobacter sp. B1805]
MTSTLLRSATPPTDAVKASSFRPDIQGLRGLAVISVLLYHLDVPFVPGGFVGVDVFFVISGFLITGLLLKQLATAGRISLVEFYARRARRLLPAATLVLVATAALTAVFLPITRWASIGWDIIASALYVQNWRLAGDSVDYLDGDVGPGPLQHFWSLGVEEQFYLVWPLLLIAAGWLATRRKRRSGPIAAADPSRLLLIGLGLVLLPSLAWSVYFTGTEPEPAYFSSTTRFWQLALGAILAVIPARLERLPSRAAAIMGWTGMAGIIGSVVLIDGSLPYPGAAALVPTISSALVIASCTGRAPLGPAHVLDTRPMTFVGDISYSLYLWHWPLIVLATAVLGTLHGTAVILVAGLSVGVAFLTYRYVERPVNRWRALTVAPVRALCAGAVLVLAGAITGGMLVNTVRVEVDRAEDGMRQAGDVRNGAMTLPGDPRSSGVRPQETAEYITPMPIVAGEDFPTCDSTRISQTHITSCQYGDTASERHVVLVGDSHAKQWIPALDGIARDKGWKLTAYIHDACPFATGELERKGRLYTTCMEWNARMQDLLGRDDRLALVITSSYTESAGIADASDDVASMSEAFQRSWSSFTRRGIPVAVIRDTPAPAINVPDCVALNLGDLTECSVPRSEAADDKGLAQLMAAASLPGTTAIDLNDSICPATRCPAVIGDVLIYRDTDHLTASYVRSLTPRLAEPLEGLVDAG